ncbi:uncharacterized protein LOC143153877 [Ptiloglossa arizonensis]|uniref:uncharacterized protein LOC143153877 n=1 Tax=Ptiloglossa arizonensis TaxID=3350558 RepID=UPI003F9F205B
MTESAPPTQTRSVQIITVNNNLSHRECAESKNEVFDARKVRERRKGKLMYRSNNKFTTVHDQRISGRYCPPLGKFSKLQHLFNWLHTIVQVDELQVKRQVEVQPRYTRPPSATAMIQFHLLARKLRTMHLSSLELRRDRKIYCPDTSSIGISCTIISIF